MEVEFFFFQRWQQSQHQSPKNCLIVLGTSKILVVQGTVPVLHNRLYLRRPRGSGYPAITTNWRRIGVKYSVRLRLVAKRFKNGRCGSATTNENGLFRWSKERPAKFEKAATMEAGECPQLRQVLAFYVPILVASFAEHSRLCCRLCGKFYRYAAALDYVRVQFFILPLTGDGNIPTWSVSLVGFGRQRTTSDSFDRAADFLPKQEEATGERRRICRVA